VSGGVSKRAEILKKLLPYINDGNYFEHEELVVFGASSFDDLFESLTHPSNEREDNPLYNVVTEFLGDYKAHHGRIEVTERLSLDRNPSLKSDARGELSQVNPPLLDAIEGALSEAKIPSEDSIDSAFTEELLGKLPRIVNRAILLSKMSLDRVPNKVLKRYFYEAHRCYLYGFSVAGAVLCRAILESALKAICDPKGNLDRGGRDGKSYFKTLVAEATRLSFLSDDRPQCALDAKTAGDKAIHDFPCFERQWESKLGEILDNTRKVLIDLYGERINC